MKAPIGLILTLSIQSWLLLLCDFASFVGIASGCTRRSSFGGTCEKDCYHDTVIDFCIPCSQLNVEEAKELCPGFSETATSKTTVANTLPITTTGELTGSLQYLAIPIVISICLVILVIAVLSLCYPERLQRILPKKWKRKTIETEQNIQITRQESENKPMIEPVQETQRGSSQV